ncbi:MULTISPECIES: hypothetical protein [Microbacterium]|uniref:DUF3040 domain-containing protein n=1 Tax=Microbacterium wangchenii TaxID=2541726 RepID=A0ABX5SV42_9MICO|nr:MULTISPECIES: hypothetical protein [Microbacterium]MCK6065250.1 hypothetical protein [Microbacterium sp. EYE_512]QBR88700.1 hypothetical protein E4K62_08350 [Microbacterium wangchenii]TFV82247.1 hypothetical protein E4V99_15160 [Microbacterium sp. dk485]TXK20424.1 hypothetical protein FVP99_01975 [Microbacterium wangchenii]
MKNDVRRKAQELGRATAASFADAEMDEDTARRKLIAVLNPAVRKWMQPRRPGRRWWYAAGAAALAGVTVLAIAVGMTSPAGTWVAWGGIALLTASAGLGFVLFEGFTSKAKPQWPVVEEGVAAGLATLASRRHPQAQRSTSG